MYEAIIACTLIVASLNLIFALIRTYINWRTLKESREYWRSWKKRRKDVAGDVLRELTTPVLERELRRRIRVGERKRKK